ncbi:hypothetical protein [Novosphingobium terrae]|uniref:hypothetical protein n=1 Tax=Novosphingobium terrae TaxID=2726189 RepID=UPI00197E7574|nr:hypothetical protein [Novosphingobium terrae]
MPIASLLLLLAAQPTEAPAAAPAATPTADPLAFVAQGLLECAEPDEASKTCHALAHFTPRPDGSFTDDTEVLLRPDMKMTLSFSGVARVKGNQVCGTVSMQMVQQAKLRFAGEPLPPEHSAELLPRIQEGMAREGLIDRELCSTRTPDGSGNPRSFTRHATIAGQPVNHPDDHLLWVSPDAGYRVAPKPKP